VSSTTTRRGALLFVCLLVSVPGCGKTKPSQLAPDESAANSTAVPEGAPKAPKPSGQLSRNVPREAQPDRLELRLVVIGCDGFGLADLIHRTPKEARARARAAAEALRAGDDLDGVVARFSDDPDRSRTHGIVLMRNYGVAPKPDRAGELTPDRLPGVAKLAFTLQPGDVAIVEPDAKEAPLGYYVLLRER